MGFPFEVCPQNVNHSPIADFLDSDSASVAMTLGIFNSSAACLCVVIS